MNVLGHKAHEGNTKQPKALLRTSDEEGLIFLELKMNVLGHKAHKGNTKQPKALFRMNEEEGCMLCFNHLLFRAHLTL